MDTAQKTGYGLFSGNQANGSEGTYWEGILIADS